MILVCQEFEAIFHKNFVKNDYWQLAGVPTGQEHLG
jgi:hypothetical protein